MRVQLFSREVGLCWNCCLIPTSTSLTLVSGQSRCNNSKARWKMIMKISTIMSANFEGLHISNIVLNPRLHYPVSLLLSSAPSNRIIQANALSTSFNFLMVLDSVFKKIWIKKYRILYPKKLVLEKYRIQYRKNLVSEILSHWHKGRSQAGPKLKDGGPKDGPKGCQL